MEQDVYEGLRRRLEVPQALPELVHHFRVIWFEHRHDVMEAEVMAPLDWDRAVRDAVAEFKRRADASGWKLLTDQVSLVAQHSGDGRVGILVRGEAVRKGDPLTQPPKDWPGAVETKSEGVDGGSDHGPDSP